MVDPPHPIRSWPRAHRPAVTPAGPIRVVVACVVTTLSLLFGGTHQAAAQDGQPPSGDGRPTGNSVAPSPAPSSGGGFLVVEPADDYRSIDAMISGARRSIDVTMYELADSTVVGPSPPIAGAWPCGSCSTGPIEVECEPTCAHRLGGGRGGCPSASASVIFHLKTVTVDRLTSAVLTGNLTPRHYPTTRDFILFDRDSAAVSAIESTFARDWEGSDGEGRILQAGLCGAPALPLPCWPSSTMPTDHWCWRTRRCTPCPSSRR